MPFLDTARLAAFDAAAFASQKPFPWWNPSGLLHEAGFAQLCAEAPAVEHFEPRFGRPRKFGQQSHDRYQLGFPVDRTDPADPADHMAPFVSDAWRAFVRELEGPAYRSFLARALGTPRFRLRMHWHYTPRGCSISPHCDSHTKLASHLFYLNPPTQWLPSHGGATLLLDPGRSPISRRSAPAIHDFEARIETNVIGNTSLFFRRTPRAWHGMAPLDCPEAALRRAFIVVVEDTRRRASWLSGRR